MFIWNKFRHGHSMVGASMHPIWHPKQVSAPPEHKVTSPPSHVPFILQERGAKSCHGLYLTGKPLEGTSAWTSSAPLLSHGVPENLEKHFPVESLLPQTKLRLLLKLQRRWQKQSRVCSNNYDFYKTNRSSPKTWSNPWKYDSARESWSLAENWERAQVWGHELIPLVNEQAGKQRQPCPLLR